VKKVENLLQCEKAMAKKDGNQGTESDGKEQEKIVYYNCLTPFSFLKKPLSAA